jgi:hypothetical protein
MPAGSSGDLNTVVVCVNEACDAFCGKFPGRYAWMIRRMWRRRATSVLRVAEVASERTSCRERTPHLDKRAGYFLVCWSSRFLLLPEHSLWPIYCRFYYCWLCSFFARLAPCPSRRPFWFKMTRSCCLTYIDLIFRSRSRIIKGLVRSLRPSSYHGHPELLLSVEIVDTGCCI